MMPKPPRLSVQLYSLRHLPALDTQLQMVRDAGLSFVETTSSNYDQVETLRGLLDRFGLAAPSGHIGIDRLRGDFDATVAIARSLGTDTLVLWGLPEAEQPRTAPAWQAAGAELGRFASRLADAGMTFAFHNHDWELERFADGATGFDHLFRGAGKAPLKWQADLAWLARGGADADALMSAHAERLVSAHLKDLAPPGAPLDEDGWADLGHGTLPWPAWWRRLEELGVDLLVLEHDEPSDPARFISRSAAFAHALPHS